MYEKHILFVCLGNICRSPMAEAVLKNLLQERGLIDKWLVDSAGIGPWHVGSSPDQRALSTLRSRQLGSNHVSRQIKAKDFDVFDHILAMDEENIADLQRIKPHHTKAVIELLGKYDPAGDIIIDDPFYTEEEKAFQKTLEHCRRACEGFLKTILQK